jgi:anti-sigma B factor antagonist
MHFGTRGRKRSLALAIKITPVAPPQDGIYYLAAEGDFTAQDMPINSRHPFEEFVGPSWGAQKILLDFEQVTYIDSSAIGWLISCHRDFKHAGGLLVLHSVPQMVKQVLDILKVGKIIPLAADEREGRAVLASGVHS